MAVQNAERSVVLHGLVPGLEAMSLAAALVENVMSRLVMNGKFKCMWMRETFWSIYCSQFNFLSILKMSSIEVP